MPNRIIKESICTSKGLSECSVFAEELYKRLIVYADDYGRFNADTEIMLARLYPRELQYITEDDLIDALIELAGIGKIAFYTAQPRKEVYGCLPKWEEHQRVRNVKAKCPDPDDTTVNDWYMRRFISADLREKIIERDGFKCQICGKYLTTMRDAKRFAKLGGGLYHIDHIIPVFQGGRATEENLRLTCPACNQSRKKRFTMDEIIDFTLSPPIAATCGELPRPVAIIQSNPIQSNPNPNTNTKGAHSRFTPPTVSEVAAYCKERHNDVNPQRFVDWYTANGWKVGKNPMKDWRAAVRNWEKETKWQDGEQKVSKYANVKIN